MTKYIVIEMQTSEDGRMGMLTYDYEDIMQAESKYYAILSAAAISTLPVHSVVLIDNYGNPLKYQSYTHITE